jgi:bifunctional non-homologous end joining protein LigD
MQQRMHVSKPSKQLLQDVPAFAYLFDVTYYGGYDTTKLTQIERKELLRGIVKYGDPLRYLEYREGDGVAYFNEICAKGEEGIIAKDGNAFYQRSRSKSWLKFKCVRQQELVIGGYTDPGSGMRGFGSLLVGYYPPGSEKMQFAGGVGTGYSDELIRDIKKKLDAIPSNENPFFPDDMLPTSEVHWVKPELVAQVGFGEWTKTNKVRHPRFLGLRRDKEPRQVTREEHAAAAAEPDNAAPAGPVRGSVNTKDSFRVVEGHKIKITNPDKMLFPDVSKGQVIDYYEFIAPYMVPHTRNRPISMQRFPDGINAQGFFHKEAPEYFPDFVELVQVYTNETDTQMQAMINNSATLVYLAQLASFVIHIWTSQAPKLEVPDKIIFDLDPSTDDSWDAVKEGAHDLRAMLKDMGLPSFVMATGSRGLHVVVPLQPEHKFDTVNLFAKAVCTTMERRDKKFTTELRKDKRKGRIFLDWLRNQYAQTGVAPYSLRPKPGATIAAPLDWEELKDLALHSNSFNVRNIAARLNGRDDPWKEFFNFRTPLPDFAKIEEILKA